jgi:hypothetical protein
MRNFRVSYYHGHRFTVWDDLCRLWSRDYVTYVRIDHPDGTRTFPDMTDAHIRRIAAGIAESIIYDARNSGLDPIAWITGNSMMPPLRSFDAAEDVWQHPANEGGEAFAYLAELLEGMLADAEVALESPESDNSLYAVDLRRFEYAESDEGDTLQDDWVPRVLCAVCQEPLDHTYVNGRDDEYVHLGDEPADGHAPVMPESATQASAAETPGTIANVSGFGWS